MPTLPAGLRPRSRTEPTHDPLRVLLIGGTSEIGLAIVRRLAETRPIQAHLLGRDREALERAASKLRSAGCRSASFDVLDADDVDSHESTIKQAFDDQGAFDAVIIAVGLLAGQPTLDSDRETAIEVMRVNFVGTGSLLISSMRAVAAHGGGKLVVLSSVAAERPRAGNPIYGASKAGIDALAQGLADAAPAGVDVLVVRPGFVHTRMTEGLKPAPFATTPERVAIATVDAFDTTRHTIWVPGGLRYLFAVLRHLPRPIYRRLPL